MRILLSIAAIVVATGLLSHGIILEGEARSALGEAGVAPAALKGVARHYPYSGAAAEARAALLDRWRTEQPPASLSDWSDLVVANAERGFAPELPWVLGRGACLLGVALLVLVVLWPRQRLRGAGLTLLIFGLLAVHAWFLDDAYMAGLIEWFSPARHALAEMPRTGVAMVFLGGVLLALPRRPRPTG